MTVTTEEFGRPSARAMTWAMARWLIPAALIIPTAIDLLTGVGLRLKWYGPVMRFVIDEAIVTTLLLLVAIQALRRLHRLETDEARAVAELAERERTAARDLRARIQAEESVEKLLSAVGQLDEVIFMTDSDGRITYANSAFERVYGFSQEETLGKTPRILKSGLVPMERYTVLWNALIAGQSLRSEYANRTKDGRLVTVQGSASPVHRNDGTLIGFIAVQQDVTERRRLEQESQQMQERLFQVGKMEALGALAGGIAHDVNNILSIILSHIAVIERLRNDPAKVERSIETIKTAIQRGAAISRQVLTFARKTELATSVVNVNQIVKEVEAMLRETLPRRVRLAVSLDEVLPDVVADPAQIHQALLNLCVNASDAMPNGGRLEIRTRVASNGDVRARFPDAPNGEYVCLEVSDNGEGMDEATQQRAFEPFFTTKETGKGTGLGLAVVYGVVKSHSGFVMLDSALGVGTTFALLIPAVLSK